MKTRKVMGNTDVAHYQGRQSIYNICILNYCKLTFEFFKNYIFEKRRQFLNRDERIPKMHWNMMLNLKSAKRILS